MKQDSENVNNSKEERYISYIFLGLLLIFSFLIGFYKIYSSDTWWHIKTGEYILSHGIPSTDMFSFTAAGNKWVTHEWLAEIFFYLIYKIGGIAALILFKGAITAIIAYLIFRFGQKRKAPAPLSAAIAIFTAAGMSYMIYARPHAFTFLFAAILLSLLFRPSQSEKSFKWERWLIIPIIFGIWANSHAGFILGLGIYWVVVAKEVIFPNIKDSLFIDRLKRSAFPALVATLVCLLNPNGYKIFTYTLTIAGNPAFKSKIAEWVSPIYLGPEEWLAKTILFIASGLGLISIILHFKKRPDISIIVLVTGVSAWFAMRNIQNYVIVLAFALLSVSSFGFISRIKLALLLKRFLILLAAVWMVACFVLIREYQKNNGRLGYGLVTGAFPVGASDFLTRVGFEGNIVNVLSDGGYLIWAGYPRWKVYIDGRLDVYGEDLVNRYRDRIQGSSDALDTFDKLDAGAAVLPMPPNIGEVRRQLAVDPRWALVYFDDYYLVYLRRNQPNQNIINQWSYNIINPLMQGYGLNNQVNINAFDIEAQKNLSINPESGLANSVCGYASQNKGEYIQAAGYYQKALKIQPRLRALYRTIGELYSSAGVFNSAITWYDRAVVYTPADAQVYVDLGYLYGRRNDLAKAEYYLNEALKRDPNNPARQLLEKLRASRTGR
jgi:tetratricopeptide (TPR) repeat protein